MIAFAPADAPFPPIARRICERSTDYGPGSGFIPAASSAPASESSSTADSAPGSGPESTADSAPDPWTQADELEELEEKIAVLAAHLHAATHRLLVLVAEYDRRRGWELGGHRSCAHWLAFRTGIDLGTAREKVRAARALVGLPETSASMQRGELSFSMVRALTRVATPDNESELLELARGCTTAQMERIVRGFRLGSRQSEADREAARHDARSFSILPDVDGMYVVRGRLTPEVGTLLMRTIDAAGDALFRQLGPPIEPEDVSSETSTKAAAQRRADAIELVAERALAAGFGGGGPDASDAPVSGTRAERYQVVLHVDGDSLTEGDRLGRSEFADGTRVSAETSRRLACDASVVTLRHGGEGEPLDAGRRTRTVPPAIRRALEARDRGCRFPGCGLRFTDAHHVRHWADGGDTKLDNLILLCSYHHRLVHEAGWKVEWWEGGSPAFRDPRGQIHLNQRRSVSLPATDSGSGPVEHLVDANHARCAEPDALTAGARWNRLTDIPGGVYFRALEALGGG